MFIKQNLKLINCFFYNILVLAFFTFLNITNVVANNLANKTLETVEPGVLTIGTNATFFPFEFVDQNGEISGYDVDLAKIIATKLGYKIKIKDMAFDALIPSIGNKIDIAIAAITKTSDREKIVSFSLPYFTATQFVLTKKTRIIENESHFKNLKIATQLDTTAQILVDELEAKLNQKLSKTYNDYVTMVNDLLNDRVDVVVCDEYTALNFEKLHSTQLKATSGKLFNWPEEFYCVVCSKQNQHLLNEINFQIEQIKNSEIQNQLMEKLKNYNDVSLKLNDRSIFSQFKTAFLDNDRWQLYLNGLKITLQITIFSAIIGLIFGMLLVLMQLLNYKVLILISRSIVDIIRGTPLLVQLLILWLVVLKTIQSSIFVSVVAFGLNSAAYVCEILRGGLNAVDKGQTEAGLAMGFNKLQTIFYIVLPQGIKNSIPPLGNEIVSLLKETSIVGYIAITDLTRVADQIRSSTYQAFMPLLIVALIYFTLTKTISILLKILERKLSN